MKLPSNQLVFCAARPQEILWMKLEKPVDDVMNLKAVLQERINCFACRGFATNQWYFSESIDDLRKKALNKAKSRGLPTKIFRIMDEEEKGRAYSFLVVRRILEAPKGELSIEWTLADTRQAAEMIRDVSHGPTPYFAVCVQEEVSPE